MPSSSPPDPIPPAEENVCAESVFNRVFLRVSPLLHRFMYYRCGDAEVAADLVQEAFVRLWENCEKVLPEAAKAYTFRVAENLFFKLHDRKKVALKYRGWMAREEPEAPRPDEVLEEKEFGERLAKAIADLPEGAREVFLLNRIDGLKYREIAAMLGISQKAVEKRMHRALTELRKIHQKI